MTEMIDLWPDEIAVEKLITPVTILRQQASLLGKKTKNIIQGEIIDLEVVRQILSDRTGFKYGFNLVASAMGNYRYMLLRISYNINLYPVIIEVEDEILKEIPPNVNIEGKRCIKANSEEQFMEILKKIFNSTKVMRIISILLSQSDPSYDPSLKKEEIQQ